MWRASCCVLVLSSPKPQSRPTEPSGSLTSQSLAGPDALRRAGADATVLTNVFTGRPARALVNRVIREVGPIADAAPAFPIPLGASASLRAAAEQRGSIDFTPLWAGQASRLGRALPARALTANLVLETMEQFRRLSAIEEQPSV